jgi:hypothetical protein
MVQGLPDEWVGQSVPGAGIVGPELHVDERDVLLGEGKHVVAGALPAFFHLDRRVEIRPRRQDHVDGPGEDVRDHRIRIADEAEDHRVDGWPSPPVAVVGRQL